MVTLFSHFIERITDEIKRLEVCIDQLKSYQFPIDTQDIEKDSDTLAKLVMSLSHSNKEIRKVFPEDDDILFRSMMLEQILMPTAQAEY
jgi:hypothetical protein